MFDLSRRGCAALAVLLAILIGPALTAEAGDDNVADFARSRGITVWQVSEDERVEGGVWITEELWRGTLDGKSVYDYKWREEDDGVNPPLVTVTFNGKSFTGTEEEAEDWSYREIDSVISQQASGGKDTGTPVAPEQRAADLVMSNVLLLRVLPRSLLRTQKREAASAEPRVPAQALAEVPAMHASWNLDANSALRFENRWYKDGDYEARHWGASLRGTFAWDRFSLDAILPVDRVTYDRPWNLYDTTRTGLVLTPRWQVLFQEKDSLDLSLGLTAFYLHSFLDKNDYEDPEHAGLGPNLSLGKTFDRFALSFGAALLRGWDTTGNDSGAGGRDFTDIVQAGLNLGVPIGERWAVNTSAIYTHTCRLPDPEDADYVTLGVGATYQLREAWSLSLDIRRHVGLDPFDNVEAHLGLGWNF